MPFWSVPSPSQSPTRRMSPTAPKSSVVSIPASKTLLAFESTKKSRPRSYYRVEAGTGRVGAAKVVAQDGVVDFGVVVADVGQQQEIVRQQYFEVRLKSESIDLVSI